MMPCEPGPLPEVRTPNHAVDDAELEWLLCLAKSFQTCDRAGERDVEWRHVLKPLITGAPYATQNRD